MKIRPYYSMESSEWLEGEPSLNKKKNVSREEIRKWILNELIESYYYPREWVGKRIKLVETEEFFGLTVLTKVNYPFLIVSIAEPGCFEKAEKALSVFFDKYPLAGLGIVSDGSVDGTKAVRKNFSSQQIEYIVDIESYQLPNKANFIYRYEEFPRDTKSRNIQSLLSEKVENVFFEAHSHLRDIDGLHADEALDELCKIIYCKLYDENETLVDHLPKMQRAIYGSTEELAVNIRMMYQQANEKVVVKHKTQNLHMGVFNTDIKLSSAALAKVVEVLQHYNLTHSNIDVKGRAFQKVINPAIRAGMGQYFTPLVIVELMVQIARPSINDFVLDPFCGSGHFLSKTFEYVRNTLNIDNEKDLEEIMKEFASKNLHGIEKSDRMVRIAMTDMMLHGDGSTHIRCSDSLLDFRNYTDLKPELYDLILTNPPFGSLLGVEAFMQLGSFVLTEGYKTVPLEVLGLERCMQFLRPGGKLGIVLPDGLLANKRTQYVREWIEEHAKIRAIISLPLETFAPFGANIKTSIIFLRKWDIGEIKEENYNIFLAQIDNIGYDATGHLKSGSEIDEVREAVLEFLDKEGW
ncbi:N-6 DNA methylase [Caldifermentibacillus hisashii]|uniref:Type I restriction enzyme M protein n=1 Tax=Tepidibacillus fermentans TaxID=1281767 RepID=A0A4R3KCF2_9BACI|nr:MULTISPECIES: N-6 DNA methylase [Bacillaceae]MED4851776.1 N-6 DNA methylase [Caldifermentibacillus hisashii]TCS80778.1 type I restriction enzyme M protein [Tepidibacillus fermentans]